MSRNRLKAKGRKESGVRFAALPANVLRSPEAHSVPGEAIRLLCALAAQFNGHNNGDMSAALSVMRGYGFNSAGTVARSLSKLEAAGLIIRTREGMFVHGRTHCALYALAWRAIDACPGKELTVAPTAIPPRRFQPAQIANRPVSKQDRSGLKTGSEVH